MAADQTYSIELNSHECGGYLRPLKCRPSFNCDSRDVWALAPSNSSVGFSLWYLSCSLMRSRKMQKSREFVLRPRYHTGYLRCGEMAPKTV